MRHWPQHCPPSDWIGAKCPGTPRPGDIEPMQCCADGDVYTSGVTVHMLPDAPPAIYAPAPRSADHAEAPPAYMRLPTSKPRTLSSSPSMRACALGSGRSPGSPTARAAARGAPGASRSRARPDVAASRCEALRSAQSHRVRRPRLFLSLFRSFALSLSRPSAQWTAGRPA